MQQFEDYVRAVTDALWSVERGAAAATAAQQLTHLETALRSQIEQLKKRPDVAAGGRSRAAKALEIRERQVFTLNWAGGGFERVVGWYELGKRIGVKDSSIRTLLSQGKGSFSIRRPNPITGERDMLTIARMVTEPEPAKRRGRPAKIYDAERLGTEFAPPARRVPK